MMPMAYLTYDKEADALFVYLGERRKIAKTVARPDISRTIHYDAQGEPISVEFWNVSRGVDLLRGCLRVHGKR
jgi:uncharacterized protein YuzE